MIRIIWRYDRNKVSLKDLSGSSPGAAFRLQLPPYARISPVFEDSREELERETESLPKALRADPVFDLARYDQTFVPDADAARAVLQALETAKAVGQVTHFELQSDIGPNLLIPEEDGGSGLEEEKDRGCDFRFCPPHRTPSLSRCQRHLDPATPPGKLCGVNARFAWTLQGGRGDGVRLVDVEGGWNPDHEDLRESDITPLAEIEDDGHGTAVLGILCAHHENDLGLKGMVPRARIGLAPLRVKGDLPNPERMVRRAVNWMKRGDVLLIEVGAIRPGEKGNGCKPTLPMEAWEVGRAALQQAHQRGIYVVEVAGNGGFDLDLVPGVPRSGTALMIGAGRLGTGIASPCSNRGERVDLQGWSRRVVTTGSVHPEGFRDLIFCPDTNRCYMKSFSGTSAASAIVAGGVASISGILKAHDFDPLTSGEMKELLIRTGSFPDREANHGIGPLPDLRAALLALEEDLRARRPGFRRFRREGSESRTLAGVGGPAWSGPRPRLI